MNSERAKSSLAHLAALRAQVDALLSRRVFMDAKTASTVQDVNDRALKLAERLLAAAPELYEPYQYRYATSWALINNKDILLMVRGEINYMIEVGARAGLCEAEHLPALPAPTLAAPSWVSIHANEIVIGVIVTVVGGMVIYALGMN